MTRPSCFCKDRQGRCDGGGCDFARVGPYTPGQCRVCWLWFNDPAYRSAWGGPAVLPGPCRHLGAEVRREQCGTCRGKVELKVFACEKHGECTPAKPLPGVACCQGCADHEPIDALREPVVRNLLYHVYPLQGSIWRWNVEQMSRRLALFNGRRIVAVATDHRTDSPRDVEAAFGGEIDEVLAVQNDPLLREVNTFEPLFSRVQSRHPSHVTFYGQAKGVSRAGGTPQRWAHLLYEVLLDYWPAVRELLATRPVAGCFKKVGRGWPDYESRGEWHYSGSFFWVRNRDLFTRDWRRIDRFWSGIEPYPSLHFAAREAACLFHEAAVPQMNLYDAGHWRGVVEPAWEAWKAEHAADKKEW